RSGELDRDSQAARRHHRDQAQRSRLPVQAGGAAHSRLRRRSGAAGPDGGTARPQPHPDDRRLGARRRRRRGAGRAGQRCREPDQLSEHRLWAALPNLISLARLLAVPLAVWLIVSDRLGVAFWLFAAAGVSDALDGFLAKHYGLQSELGGYLVVWGWRALHMQGRS